jgi:aspartate-semialdehyde dehydrogenase
MKVAVVGVTGMVGQVMCRVLEERNFPITEFIPVASEKSVGKEVMLNGKAYRVVSMETAISMQPDIAIFSAGGSTAKEFAPKFAAVGTTVIDNSSAFRMDEDKPLIVPEVNIADLKPEHKIIANPNCSTIQMVVALMPLHKAYGIQRLVISTYQSMTGTGVKAVKQYEEELHGQKAENPAYHYQIFQNCIPHCDVFNDNGYTKEEMKLVHETKKILGDNSLRITATAVRVPVLGGHSEAVNVEFKHDFDLVELRQILSNSPGIVLMDDINNNLYPMPLLAQHKDEVFVGRLRRDESQEKTLNMWIVADNLRKGAATNAIQIAEYLVKKGWLQQLSMETK